MLKEYAKNGLVTAKAGWYSCNIEGKIIKLGQAKAAEVKLKALIDDGKIIIPTNETPAKSGTTSKSSDTLDVALAKTSETTQKKNSKLEKMLGQIRDINPDYSTSNLTVSISGISYLQRSNPVVASYPLEFYWLEKKNSVDGGNGVFSNGDYTVFDKEWAKDDDGNVIVSWKRDDTPMMTMVTVGTLVLCCCKREQFYNKKDKQQMKGQIAHLVVNAKRQEQAKGAAILAEKQGPEMATEVYKASSDATIAQAAQVEHVKSGVSLKEAHEKISSNGLTPDKLKSMVENNEIDIDSLA